MGPFPVRAICIFVGQICESNLNTGHRRLVMPDINLRMDSLLLPDYPLSLVVIFRYQGSNSHNHLINRSIILIYLANIPSECYPNSKGQYLLMCYWFVSTLLFGSKWLGRCFHLAELA